MQDESRADEYKSSNGQRKSKSESQHPEQEQLKRDVGTESE